MSSDADAAAIERAALRVLEEVRTRHPEHRAALGRVRLEASRRLTRSAGNADPRTGIVRISVPIFRLAENASMLRNTVLHELAHIIAGPAARPHGPRWRAVFLALGGDGRRTHTLRAAGERPGRLARCVRCDGAVEIGPRRHRRLLAGAQRYVHVGCGGRIVPAESGGEGGSRRGR